MVELCIIHKVMRFITDNIGISFLDVLQRLFGVVLIVLLKFLISQDIDKLKIQASNDIPVNPVPVPKIPCYTIAKNGLYDLLSQSFSITQIKNPLAVS